MLTLNKMASAVTPAAGKGRLVYFSTKNCFAWVDENAAQWWTGDQRVLLTADLSTIATTTLTDATGLSFAVAANTYYHFEFCLLYTSSTATTGLKLGLTAPAGIARIAAGVNIYGRGADGGSTWGYGGTLIDVAASDSVTADQADTGLGVYPAFIKGVLVTGSTAGTLQLQYAGEAATNVIARAGSYGWLRLS